MHNQIINQIREKLKDWDKFEVGREVKLQVWGSNDDLDVRKCSDEEVAQIVSEYTSQCSEANIYYCKNYPCFVCSCPVHELEGRETSSFVYFSYLCPKSKMKIYGRFQTA